MPLDIGHHVKNWTHNFANHNFLGKAFANPIWIGIIVIAIIFILIYIIGWDDRPSFKLIFYCITTSITLLIIHDSMLRSQLGEATETDAGIEMVNDIHQIESDSSNNIIPRSAPDAIESFKRNIIDSQNINTADELNSFVQKI